MKKRMITIGGGFLCLLALGVIAQAQGAKVAGTWTMSYTNRVGTVMARLILMQDGNNLKGSMKIDDGFDAPLDGGTVSGKDITLSVTRQQGDGSTQKTEYKGTV